MWRGSSKVVLLLWWVALATASPASKVARLVEVLNRDVQALTLNANHNEFEESPSLGLEEEEAVGSTVLITGLVKDAANTLPSLLKDLANTACMFRDASFIVLGGDSHDATATILENFVHDDMPECTLKNRNSPNPFSTREVIFSKPSSTERIHRLVEARNELRAHLKEKQPQHNWDLIMMVDMDIVSLNTAELKHQLRAFMPALAMEEQHQQETTTTTTTIAAAANSLSGVCLNDHHRDTFATVAEDGSWAFYRGTRVEPNFLNEFNTQKAAGENSGTGLIPVLSCFNAATIYKATTYLSPHCQYHTTEDAIAEDPKWQHYTSRVDSMQMCEHVYFHDCLRRNDRAHLALTAYDAFVTHADQVSWRLEEEEEAVTGSLATLRKWNR